MITSARRDETRADRGLSVPTLYRDFTVVVRKGITIDVTKLKMLLGNELMMACTLETQMRPTSRLITALTLLSERTLR